MDLPIILIWAIVGHAITVAGLSYLFYYAIKEVHRFLRYRVTLDDFDFDDLGEFILIAGWTCILLVGLYFAMKYAPFELSFDFTLKVE